MASNSPAFDASEICIDSGVLTVSGDWPAKISRLTDSPDAQVSFSDTPGQKPNPKFLVDYPVITCLVRGAKDDYAGAWSKARQIKDVLLGMNPVNLASADRWDGCTMMSDISSIGHDQNSRPILSMNFRVILEVAAANAPLSQREQL
jgi:hypothetical protein